MDSDIEDFINAIGAREPEPGGENYLKFKQIFKRSNYFIYEDHFLIVKISKSDRPFWGVGKVYVDLLNSVDDYFLVLLSTKASGWLFSKQEVNHKIECGDRRLRETDGQYKINPPSLRHENRFNSPEEFKEKIGVQMRKKGGRTTA